MEARTNSSHLSSFSTITICPPSPIYLLSNICNLVTLRLDSTNFVAWKFQITSILRVHSLQGYIDRCQICPELVIRNMNGELTTTVNSAYTQWITQDQALFTFISATLSASALYHVIGCKSSREAWIALEQRIKEIKDKLIVVSIPVEDEDLLIHILNGLPAEYNAFKTSIRTRLEHLSIEEIHALLQVDEQTNEQSNKTSTVTTPAAAMTASYGRSQFSNFRGNSTSFRDRGRGRPGNYHGNRYGGRNNYGRNNSTSNNLINSIIGQLLQNSLKVKAVTIPRISYAISVAKEDIQPLIAGTEWTIPFKSNHHHHNLLQ
ncbi:hypothetical protein F0562_036018 [Nyssa sinensis]|uniref:Uncharacterized protein n=1 Tax=Nyssa sinensis TaxID=561372 RepID=A0A5J5ACH6_9ASTE|nr:hypothetical protein F0562_036018 [Nyssa sinensis]